MSISVWTLWLGMDKIMILGFVRVLNYQISLMLPRTKCSLSSKSWSSFKEVISCKQKKKKMLNHHDPYD